MAPIIQKRVLDEQGGKEEKRRISKFQILSSRGRAADAETELVQIASTKKKEKY